MSLPAAVAETHISVVLFIGDRAVKVLKSLRTDVLDHTTVEQRGEACRREVDLNRRIAPDVYEGVATVEDEQGDVVEHLILMRRLPADARLSLVVAQPDRGAPEVRAVAQQVARFHRSADRSPQIDVVATPAGLRQRWDEDLAGAAPYAGRWLSAGTLAELGDRARTYLDGRSDLLEERIAAGWIRDGHGDLLADDVFCLEDGPRIIDCLAFADELRWGDVVADVAFLAMDLERLGRADLAEVLLAEHAELLDDAPPSSLIHLYTAQRALVRAKVRALRAEQGDATAGDEAATTLDLAVQHLREGEVRLVLVGGAPGTGKSNLSRGMAAHLGARLLRSDVLRKERAGLDPTTDLAAPVDQGEYRPAQVDEVYDELLARASAHLRHGETVVLDASWSSPRHRQAARTAAREAHARIVEVRASAPLAVCQQRVARRREHGSDASDATPELVGTLTERFAPWPEAQVVSTTGTKAASLEAALAHLEA